MLQTGIAPPNEKKTIMEINGNQFKFKNIEELHMIAELLDKEPGIADEVRDCLSKKAKKLAIKYYYESCNSVAFILSDIAVVNEKHSMVWFYAVLPTYQHRTIIRITYQQEYDRFVVAAFHEFENEKKYIKNAASI